MSPEEFVKLKDRDKWELSKTMITLHLSKVDGIQWICGKCGCDQLPPERTWDGSICCSECDHTLTRRTGGGQNDPFGYSFRYRIQEIREEKLNALGI